MSALSEVENVTQTPGWLLLENKTKKRHKLAHEIGAGAACLNCSTCPGLDLHFWRKLCKACKCKKEEHDVKDEDAYGQFEILLGAGQKKTATSSRLNINVQEPGKGSIKQNVPMEWVPPGVPETIAEDYMNQLPVNKLPISGSEGAAYRRKQLEKQVPIHDLDSSKCHNLTVEEIESMQEYLENLKSNVVGQGQIMKVPVMFAEERMRYGRQGYMATSAGGATVHQQYSQQIHKLEDRQNNNVETGSMRDPSVLHEEDSEQKSAGHSVKAIPYNLALAPRPFVSTAQSNALSGGEGPEMSSILDDKLPSFKGAGVSLQRPMQFVKKPGVAGYQSDGTGQDDAPPPVNYGSHPGKIWDLENENLPPPPPELLLPTAQEDVQHLDIKGHASIHEAKNANDVNMPGMTGDMLVTTPMSYTAKVVPGIQGDAKLENLGEDDSLPEQFGNLEIENKSQTWICRECNEEMKPGEVVVLAERAGSNICWHPQCFVCRTCKEMLVDLIYFYHEDDIYCGRHYAAIVDIPRCNACDELIFVKEYTAAEAQTYHVKHFCCFECDVPLGGMKYIPVDGQPHCLGCHQKKYGKICKACNIFIDPQEQGIVWKDLHWHATESCFCCYICKKNLLGGKFAVKNEKLACSKECLQVLKAGQ